MTRPPHGDIQAELDELRRRLGELEARHRDLLRGTSDSRRPGNRTRLLAGALCAGGLLAAAGLLHGESASNALALFIDPRGWVGIGTNAPQATLDVAGTLNVGDKAALASANVKGALEVGDKATLSSATVKGTLDVDDKAAFSSASVKGPLTVGGKMGVGTTEPGASLDVNGVLRAKVLEATTPLRNRMYPPDPIVYQDIFVARDKGVVVKLGNPAYDDRTYSGQTLWNAHHIIKFGGNNEQDGNGVKVSIPKGYDTVWIRVLGDRWNAVHAYFLDGGREDLGRWTGGNRSANSYAPDGSLTDGYTVAHQWVPIPAGRAGELALISQPNTSSEFWLSGVAFSTNPWGHAAQSAVGYHWRVNGGDATLWANGWENWNGDILSKINPGTNLELKVPVVPSGRDKLLYLVEHNNNWNGTMHTGITVDGRRIERFLATYDNPFARHWNSKLYDRYIAARIPAELIPANARYLSVRIDMTQQNEGIHFREIGTHDLDVPWGDGSAAARGQPAGK